MASRIRMTRQRRLILDELRKSKNHPTADELYGRVRMIIPRISLGTVYRNLEMLNREGLISKIEFADSPKRFDGEISAHNHIRCVRCGDVHDLPDIPLISECDIKAVEDTGYLLVGKKVEFSGVCPRCIEEERRGGS